MIVLIPRYFCLEMIVLLPKSFCPKMNVQLLFYLLKDIKKTFDTAKWLFQGCFIVIAISYYECHTYNYSLNGERALILPILENKTIPLGRREYLALIVCNLEPTRSGCLEKNYLNNTHLP